MYEYGLVLCEHCSRRRAPYLRLCLGCQPMSVASLTKHKARFRLSYGTLEKTPAPSGMPTGKSTLERLGILDLFPAVLPCVQIPSVPDQQGVDSRQRARHFTTSGQSQQLEHATTRVSKTPSWHALGCPTPTGKLEVKASLSLPAACRASLSAVVQFFDPRLE